MLKLTLMAAGYCTQNRAVTMRGEPWQTVRFPAIFGLIEHPDIGIILYDTGYAPHFAEATQHFPYRLYAMLTPVYVQPHETAAAQLVQRGIAPEDVSIIILSHFHADHLCGLRDFPNAQFIYFAEAYQAVRGKTGVSAVRNAFLPSLLPEDFEARSKPVLLAACEDIGSEFTPFTRGADLLGDGSVIGVPLPGHAVGQMGIIANTTTQSLRERAEAVFLVADAAWHSEAYRGYRTPTWVGNLAQADVPAYKNTLAQLHQLYQHCPALPILPSHCEEVCQQWVTS